MNIPVLFYFKGYTKQDPFDKAPAPVGMAVAMGINFLLTLLLFFVVTQQKIVYFNGFYFLGHSFSGHATQVVGWCINGLVLTPLIVMLRKCSSLVTAMIVLVPYYLLDLYIESHFRQGGSPDLALWNYYDDSIVSFIRIPALKFIITLGVDAFILGVFGPWLSRLLLQLAYHKKPNAIEPTSKQYSDFFSKKWSEEKIPKPTRDLAFYVLKVLGSGYLLYLFLLLLGLLGEKAWPAPVQDLITMTYANPALAIITYFKIVLMTTLSFTAAYNKSLRHHACIALLTGHAVSTVYSLAFHFITSLDTSDPTNFLLASAITDGVMMLLFTWIIFRYKKEADQYKPSHDLPINFSVPLTLVKSLYIVMTILFICITAGIVAIRIFTDGSNGLSAVFGSPDPMIGNAATLYATLACLSSFLIKREKLRNHFFNAIIIPLLLGGALSILWLIGGDLAGGVFILTRHDGAVSVNWYFPLFACIHFLIATLMTWFRKLYYTIDYSVNTLSPSAALDVMALSNAFFNTDNQQQSTELHLVDRYAGGIRGRRRGLLNLPFALFENVLNLLYGFRPSFSSMQRDEQRYYLHRYFLRDEMARKSAFIPPLAEAGYQVGVSLNSLITFAHFSSINVRNQMQYVPVDARDRTQGDMPLYPPPHKFTAPLPMDETDPANYKPLSDQSLELVAPRVTTPVKEEILPEEADYLVIGSGAGGATAAYRLACAVKDPGKIILLERGTRYQPLQDFQDNEIEMMKKVYKEGGLQQTKSFDMTVLQGECVGGTTVINNAVCFTMPDNIRKIWGETYDIDLSELDEVYDIIAKELRIAPLGNNGVNEEVYKAFEKAVTEFNLHSAEGDRLKTTFPVKVNHLNTMGDGNWNIGNKRMRKRSMLETYIPWAEARGVKVVPNMTAVQFITDPSQPGRASAVVVRTDNGHLQQIRINKAVIVAGGVISSSHFLMRSLAFNDNIGKGLSCNFAFPLTFQFPQPLRAYDGDQITMAAIDPGLRAIFETYFNPPAAFALASIPFFFDKRDNLVDKYIYMINLGALIGSEPNGEVLKKADLINGQAFTWQTGETDTKRIKFAIKSLITMAKYAGAVKVVIPTRPGIELDLTSEKDISDFLVLLEEFPLRMKDFPLSTAHPQGGNLVAGNNSAFKSQRVVDGSFCVEGFENVFVADASLFPTSITVNPQWTVMAMSSLACRSIVKRFEQEK
ncbi:MAG: GMC family oxidoreductase N-terminal domain-containing protein [Ferruginibacter sp.]